MLQIAADVGAVHPQRVVAVSTSYMVCLAQWFAQVAAHQVLVPQFCAKGGAPCLPVKIGVHAHPVHIRAVVVVLHLLWHAAVALVAVKVLVPVYAGSKVQLPTFRLALYGAVHLGGVLILVVGLPLGCGIKSAAAPAFVRYA